MNRSHLGCLVGVTLALAGGLPAWGAVLPGGGPKKSDCYIGFEVRDSDVTMSNGKNRVDQQSVGGQCTFHVKLCVNEPVSGCTPADVTDITKAPSELPKPAFSGSTHVCGDEGTITLSQKKKKKAKRKIKAIGIASASKPKKDPDTLLLRCLPGGTTTTTLPGAACGGTLPSCPADTPATCPSNPDGGPRTLRQTTIATGTDLDNGFSGDSHNFPVIQGSTLEFCLSGCNDGSNPATANPNCTLCARTGEGTTNTPTFGPPLPLVAGGVPVCVINTFKDTVLAGTANVQTGEMAGELRLASTVITTPANKVCPECRGGATDIGQQGRCDAGPSQGQTCTVEGKVTVNADNPVITNQLYLLSHSCPPGGLGTENAGTLDIDLPLCTGTVTKTGPKPCPGQLKDDACPSGGTCGPSCPSGQPLKGGVNQDCCSNEPTRPCFPTAGGGSIMRTGVPAVPQPPWPDATYPKMSTGESVVGLFCIAATSSNTINQVAGLPGPGALILPVTQVWEK